MDTDTELPSPTSIPTTSPVMEDVPQPKNDQNGVFLKWKQNPNPQNLSAVLKTVKPVIDYHLDKNPALDRGVLSGHAKSLAIGAIKTFDPSSGASLNTHVYNRLQELSRKKQELNRVLPVSRDMSRDLGKYNESILSFFEEHNREPSDDEIQDLTGFDKKRLLSLRRSGRGEIAEGQMEFSSGQEENPRLSMWTDYVYHDLDPHGKLILDYKLGRNGNKVLSNEEIAQRLKMDTSTVSRRAAEIARKIMEGARE